MCVIPLVPDPPRNVKISLLDSTSVAVSWDDPADNKGVIQGYIVHYFCVDLSRCDDDNQSRTKERRYTITGLNPYTNYSIEIIARTVAGEGQGSQPVTFTTLEAGEKPLKC